MTSIANSVTKGKDEGDNGDDDRMRRNPTHLPEILLLIGRHLSQGELTSCVRVSHVWHHYLEPLLWSNVSLLHPPQSNNNNSSRCNNSDRKHHCYRDMDHSTSHEASVVKNVRHLRSLDIEHIYSPFLQHQLIPVLQNRLFSLSVEEYNSAVRQILQQNAQTLQTFVCRNVTSRQRQHHSLPQPAYEATELWLTLSSVTFLSELTLSAACVYTSDLRVFFQICERLEILSLENGSVANLSPYKVDPLTNLRRLLLHRVSVNPLRELDFIANCPNLEHLAWRPLDNTPLNPFMFHLVTLAPDRLARITSLDVSQTDLFDKQLATILSSGLRLTRLVAVHSPFGAYCADQVVCSMADTLEELDIRQCHLMVQNPMLQIMLMTCKRLRYFRADEISVNDMSKNTFFSDPSSAWSQPRFARPGSSNAAGGPMTGGGMVVPAPTSAPLSSMRMMGKAMQGDWQWACLELEELDVTFVGNYLQPHSILTGLPLVYSQLAQLTELRRLVYGWKNSSDERRLSLSSGSTFGSVDGAVGLSSSKGSPPSSAASSSSSTSSPSSSSSTRSTGGPETQKSPHFRAGLRRLWKLTQLRVFDVEKVQNPDFSVSDVRWIGKRWEGLRRIQGRLSMDPVTELAIQELVQKEFPHITHNHDN
ncbi:hypothetical protein K457DRAFT_16854 [Linnemannia elongata AG-77]|uniref:F-box domain-containing protein n=1 Tax=Linnemannia elongata AG-77 TaxID=1314771 RepID=A0A197K693_9FUNG|nr:hypothetical protein K457DRAFT_16854 [Linnemannia elongata AG-77]